MYFIVCSDNHGKRDGLEKIKKHYPDALEYLHCGDIELPEREMKDFKAITGNNDYFYRYPESLIVEIEGFRIFMIHSHQVRYRHRIEDLAQLAKDNNCQVVCFGHTHIYQVEEYDGILCINPGSLYYNRDGSEPSYALVRINNGELAVERKLLSELS